MFHIHVLLVAPLGTSYIAQASADQHKSGVAVRESTHHPGAAANLPVEPLNDIVGADPRPMLRGEIIVGERLLDGGLYELEKAIADESINTPSQYGNLRTFKAKWLGKFKAIGIQPVVIPDDFNIDEFPSIPTLLLNLQGGHIHVD